MLTYFYASHYVLLDHHIDRFAISLSTSFENQIVRPRLHPAIQPIIDKMNAIHWKGSREKFQAAHQQEIDLYYTSQRILTEKHGVKKIDILRWKKEQTALRHEEEERSAQYKPLREKLDLMLNVKYCVDEAKRRINKELIQTKQKQKNSQFYNPSIHTAISPFSRFDQAK